MNIHDLTVCVNYADHFAHALPRWMAGLASLTIVTDTSDEATRSLALAHATKLHRTDAFYAAGAAFNKGAAMEEARRDMPWEDWILFFDADVVPPADWLKQLWNADLRPGILHGAKRFQATPATIDDTGAAPIIDGDGIAVGFFQLFHSSDVRAQDRPLLETDWAHAGNYDSSFLNRWPRDMRKLVPFRMAHLGEQGNWFGRGNRDAMREMHAERRRRGGTWQHERIAVT